ncbi:MAG: hypothetical protein HYY06_18160 [Deltaproteobacteria bacterium]|nr:hypothetical protein [Deltaproteobacteria bacterium]
MDAPTRDDPDAPEPAPSSTASAAVAPGPATTRELLPYAILTGLCGLLPVPIVDDFAASLARGAMLRRVAHRHDLRLDRFAQRLLVRASYPIGGAPGQIALSALRVAFRKVFLVVNVGLRADDALATFVLGHLFDRYCRELHRRDLDGEWVTESRAGQIRAAVDGSLRGAGSAVLREVFARALGSGWEWLRSVPGAVMTFVGSVIRRDEKGGEESVEELLREEKGFFGRVADLTAEGIGAVGDDYFRSVENAFDESMGNRQRASSGGGAA